MSDMLVPLLDHSNPENIQRFNDFCKIFFKDYDKNNKGYISKKDLKEPLNEISQHFANDSLSYFKLKMLFSLLEDNNNKDNKNKTEQLNKLIDTINSKESKIENNVVDILDKDGDNKINFDEFKEVVKLLLYCLIDIAAENELDNKSNQNNTNSFLIPPKNEGDDLLEIIFYPDENEGFEEDEFIINFDEMNNDEIIKFFDDVLNLEKEIPVEDFVIELVEEIKYEFKNKKNILVDDLKIVLFELCDQLKKEEYEINIKENDIEKLFDKNGINIGDKIKVSRMEQIVFTFFMDIFTHK